MPTRYPSTMRARDEDRVHACASLDEAFADGQLPEDEYELRVELAKDAHTLADLHDLIDDLQGDSDLVPMAPPGLTVPSLARVRRRGVVTTLVRWLVLVAIVAAIFFGVRACLSDDSATGVYGSSGYLAPAAFDDLVASGTAMLGTTVVDDMTFYPEYVLLSVQSEATPRRDKNYQFRDGEWKQYDDGDRDPTTNTVDLADLRPGVLAGLIAGAGESLNLGQIDSQYLFVRGGDDGPYISLHADNELNENGYLDATLAGDFIRVTPFDPDS